MKQLIGILSFCSCLMLTAWSQEPVNSDLNDAIRKHGMVESQVMDIAGWLVDVHGPRLTGSPQLDKATEWAVGQLKSWGLKNVHTEEWGPFGRGWELKHFEMHAVEPSYYPIIACPKAWSPSVKGSGEVIYLDAANEEQLAAYKGKLKGKIVMIDTLRNLTEWFEPPAKRIDAQGLLDLANKGMPTPRVFRNWRGSGADFVKMMYEFLHTEQPLALIDRAYKGDGGTIFVSGARSKEGRSRDKDAEVLPQITIGVEYYNRIFRMLKKGITVKLNLDMKAEYTNPDGMEHNIFAEIPGTDLKDEIVMFGAHFDSWHSSTGATDNGAGSSVMMEVARILQQTIRETGIQPRRTLRLALWTGEEQGLLGSKAYVEEHFAETDDRGNPLSLKKDQEKISAYYNMDNGTGKVRGVYLQGNPDVAPIFRAWLDPFSEDGATTLTLSNTGGTDHLGFDAVGIPGFQFIQDPISYWAKTHHSNMDNYDHLIAEDLMQASTVIASFVMHTAMREEMIPRKQLVLTEKEVKEEEQKETKNKSKSKEDKTKK